TTVTGSDLGNTIPVLTVSSGKTLVTTMDASGLVIMSGGATVSGTTALTVSSSGGLVVSGGTLDASAVGVTATSLDVGSGNVVLSNAGAVTAVGAVSGGSLSTGGTLDVDGISTLGVVEVSGGLTVTGAALDASAVDVTGSTLSATGSVSGASLSVSGGISSTGSGTISTGGAINGGTVAATGTVSGGSLSTGGTLGVTGTSTLGVVNASGLVSAQNGLAVTGAALNASAVTVTANTLTVGGSHLSVSGAGVSTDQSVSISSSVAATAGATTGALIVAGGTYVGGNVVVGGNVSTATGDVTATTGTVTGSQLVASLVDGAVNSDGTMALDVAGSAKFGQNAFFMSDISVAGTVNLATLSLTDATVGGTTLSATATGTGGTALELSSTDGGNALEVTAGNSVLLDVSANHVTLTGTSSETLTLSHDGAFSSLLATGAGHGYLEGSILPVVKFMSTASTDVIPDSSGQIEQDWATAVEISGEAHALRVSKGLTTLQATTVVGALTASSNTTFEGTSQFDEDVTIGVSKIVMDASLGSISSGAITSTGDSTLQTLYVNGDTSVNPVDGPGAASLVVKNSALVGGTFGVDGNTTLSGLTTLEGGLSQTLVFAGTAMTNVALTADMDVSSASGSDQSTVLSITNNVAGSSLTTDAAGVRIVSQVDNSTGLMVDADGANRMAADLSGRVSMGSTTIVGEDGSEVPIVSLLSTQDYVIGLSTQAEGNGSLALGVVGDSDFTGLVGVVGSVDVEGSMVLNHAYTRPLGSVSVQSLTVAPAAAEVADSGHVVRGLSITNSIGGTTPAGTDSVALQVSSSEANSLALHVSAGKVLMGGALEVDGYTTLDGLSARSSEFLSVTTSGNEWVGGTLTVMAGSSLGTLEAGASTLASLTVTGSSVLSGLNAGASTLASMNVTSNALVGGTFGVTGTTTLAGLTATDCGVGSITTSGNVVVGGTLTVTAGSSLDTLEAGAST
ncbi:MAG: hypothetical protein VXY56_03355, partial [Pseudomonadota bacterium]|nr:hypothetical protein [Pseudomonadota bacterium]